ncbi:YIP1 family protein [Chitinivibrio alkaliphilus]|uniref:Uncharacterized protein n=1 Tax=Chitinivibrio alkaliphilus ACht1 TaxID=1313304 RepID=U7DD84_9BACT|nr:YIP1 family protein [Chitinivibrio alkaliphilus]ERP38841.1 hypothetical protein CALK_0614 [Chitinivibrio alkaliphilus ACht1]
MKCCKCDTPFFEPHSQCPTCGTATTLTHCHTTTQPQASASCLTTVSRSQDFLSILLSLLKTPSSFFSPLSSVQRITPPLFFFLLILTFHTNAWLLSGNTLFTESAQGRFHQRIHQQSPHVSAYDIEHRIGLSSFPEEIQTGLYILNIPLTLAGSILSLFLLSLITFVFLKPAKSQLSFSAFFAVYAYGSMPMLVSFIPILGPPIAIGGALIYYFKGLSILLDKPVRAVVRRMILPLGIPLILCISFTVQTALFRGNSISTNLFSGIVSLLFTS